VFAIALKEEQYKTYILSDQASQSRLEVIPERGGIVTSWSVQGQELFYLDAERLTHPELTVRGGIPILFPICGNLPDNAYTYNEQAYTLKQHGFAREMAWDVSDRLTQDAAALTVVLTSTEQTKASYPFDFQVSFTYRIQGNSLELHQEVTNRSAEPMPFSLGLHPYFHVADKNQLKFNIPSTEFLSKDGATHPFSGSFDFEQDEIDILFYNLSGSSALVTDAARNLQLQLDYESPYTALVFWAVKGKDFYCLEPWTAPRNAMNTGDRLTHLDPGATLKTLVRLTVSFI
jgi:galactose mutarotase-like enzyme